MDGSQSQCVRVLEAADTKPRRLLANPSLETGAMREVLKGE